MQVALIDTILPSALHCHEGMVARDNLGGLRERYYH